MFIRRKISSNTMGGGNAEVGKWENFITQRRLTVSTKQTYLQVCTISPTNSYKHFL